MEGDATRNVSWSASPCREGWLRDYYRLSASSDISERSQQHACAAALERAGCAALSFAARARSYLVQRSDLAAVGFASPAAGGVLCVAAGETPADASDARSLVCKFHLSSPLNYFFNAI